MIPNFTSLFDLFEAFPDEQACLDHLRAMRWRDGEFCPHCSGARVYHFSDKKRSSAAIAANDSASRLARSFTTPNCRCASGSWLSG